jgi:hypothetical protein
VPCTTPAGEHHTKKAFLHKHSLTGFTAHAYSFKCLALPRLPSTSPFSPDLMRVTHAHPLNPTALAFVPFGIVLVRVRVPGLMCGCLSLKNSRARLTWKSGKVASTILSIKLAHTILERLFEHIKMFVSPWPISSGGWCGCLSPRNRGLGSHKVLLCRYPRVGLCSPQTRPHRLHNPHLLIQAPCTSALAPHLPFSA